MTPKNLMRLAFTLLILLAVAPLKATQLEICCPATHYDLNVSFDLPNHQLTGKALLSMDRDSSNYVGFLLNPSFTVLGCRVNGVKVTAKMVEAWLPEEISPNYGVFGEWDPSNATLWMAKIPYNSRKADSLKVEITWEGTLYTPPDNRQFSRERIAFEVNGTIGEEGIYLSPSAWWYPGLPDCQATHRLTAKLPAGWNAVTAGDPSWVETEEYTEVTHVSDFPLEGINFSAAPFEVKEIDHDGIRVMTYFLPAEAELADGYLQSCTQYLTMYSEMLGDYPFPKFAVVDNFMPSGYGMPGWTLLGSEVLHLPFIRYTSLGHEILHNWFGNSLLVDYRGGNWCEGLTVYLADHKYKNDRSPTGGVEYRRDVLRDYTAYVNDGNDYPLTDFIARAESSDRAIGYGKSMMTFHMLKMMGDQTDPNLFIKALREMVKRKTGQAISWNDWQEIFSEVYGENLDWFFDQWVNGMGAPLISFEDVVVKHRWSKWSVELDIQTHADIDFRYLLPIETTTDDSESQKHWVEINSATTEIHLKGKGKLTQIHVDPDFDVFRGLYGGEIPATLASFFGDPEGVFLVEASGEAREAFLSVAEGLKHDDQDIVENAADIEDGRSRWVMGEWKTLNKMPEYQPLLKKIAVELSSGMENNAPAANVTVNGVFRLEDENAGVIVLTAIGAEADPVSGTRKLPHYGKYSYLMFDGDRAIGKGILPPTGENPLLWHSSQYSNISE